MHSNVVILLGTTQKPKAAADTQPVCAAALGSPLKSDPGCAKPRRTLQQSENQQKPRRSARSRHQSCLVL